MIKEGKQNAFVREFGCKIFEYRDRNLDYAEVFNQAMTSYSTAQTTWALEAFDNYDFSNIPIYAISVEALDIYLAIYF